MSVRLLTYRADINQLLYAASSVHLLAKLYDFSFHDLEYLRKLAISANLYQLLCQVVTEGITHQFGHMREGLFYHGLKERLVRQNYILQISTTTLVLGQNK
jgi:hypothetical protein